MNTTTRPTTLLQDLASLPGQYWILFGGTLVNRFGNFVMPFLVIYLKMHGYDERSIGFTLGAYGAGGLCAGFLGGWLSDRLGRKQTMMISCVGAASFMLLLSQAASVPMFMLTTFMTGLSSGIYGPAAGALIADLIPPELRVRAFACQRWAINVGFALGMATAGFMAKKSFLALFVADALTTLLLGLTILIGLKPRAVPPVAKAKSGWGHALRHMNGNTPFKLASIAGFLITLVFLQMSCTYSLQTTQGAGLDERTYGLLMAFNGIMIACLELPLIGITRRFSPVKVIATGYILLGAGMGLNALGATLPVLIFSMGIFTMGEMIALPVSNGYMAGLAPDEMRGRYQGVVSITWSSATMVGPTFGIMLYHFNPTVLWTGIVALSLVAAWLMLVSRGKAGRLEQGIPQSPTTADPVPAAE